jgi:MFS family permease
VSSGSAGEAGSIIPISTSPLSFRDFNLLTGGQTLSGIGTQMQVVAVAWQIYLITGHSKLALGLIGLARGLPLIVASLFSGILADAFDRRRTLLVTQSVLAALSAILVVLTATGTIRAESLYLVIAGASAAQAVDQPTRSSMVPSLVSREALPRALSLLVSAREFAVIAGPALGGVVIAATGGVEANYVVDAASYTFVLAAVFMIRTPTQNDVDRPTVSLKAVIDGWKFIIHNRIILAVQGLDFLANFFAASTVLFPVFAGTVYKTGPAGLGVLYGAGSLGAVVGALLFAFFGRVRRQGAVILISIFVYGLAITAFGFSPWYLMGAGFLVISGAADSVSATLRGTISQLVTPDSLRGRVTAVNTMFVAGGPQIGNLEAGAVAAAVGVQDSVALGGIITCVVVVVAAIWSRRIREFRLEDAVVASPSTLG